MTQDSDSLLQHMAVKQAEIANDVKHMVKWSETHDTADTTRFEKIEKSLSWQSKILYGCIGVVAFLEFIVKFIK